MLGTDDDRWGTFLKGIPESLTAGLDVQYEPTKNNLPTNQKGYDTFETTAGMLSARRIQICFDYFCLGIILEVIQYIFQNNA